MTPLHSSTHSSKGSLSEIRTVGLHEHVSLAICGKNYLVSETTCTGVALMAAIQVSSWVPQNAWSLRCAEGLEWKCGSALLSCNLPRGVKDSRSAQRSLMKVGCKCNTGSWPFFLAFTHKSINRVDPHIRDSSEDFRLPCEDRKEC